MKKYIKLGVNEANDYTLMVRVDEETLQISPKDPTPYIVGYHYDETTKSWGQGHYFSNIVEAVQFMEK